jgi:hypothetical protein
VAQRPQNAKTERVPNSGLVKESKNLQSEIPYFALWLFWLNVWQTFLLDSHERPQSRVRDFCFERAGHTSERNVSDELH